MDALFIVPTLVSPQVNEKMIPALAKMIERNIILNNSALFKKAALAKYSRYTVWNKVKNENSIPITILSDSIITEDNHFESFGEIVLSEAKAKDYFTGSGWSDDIKAAEDRLKTLETQKSNTTNLDEKKELAREIDNTRKYILDLRKQATTYQSNDDENGLSEKEKVDIKDSLVRSKINQIGLKKSKYDFEQQKKIDKTARSAELNTYRDSSYVKPDEIEAPTGIQFFRQISLEPTILSIPIAFGSGNRDGTVAKVGVKCIPYVLDDVTSILALLREARNMGTVERLFKNAFRKINTKVWFSKRREIYKGKHLDPNEATEAIKYSPSTKELVSYINLARSFDLGGSSTWSTMIVLSSFDIENNEDLIDLVQNYRKLTKYVFGDIIITNETKESAYFCTPRFNNCQELPYTYLSKVLNLSDVIDYSDASRASAWRKETNVKNSNAKTAIKEDAAYNEVKRKIKNILKSGY